MNKRTTHHYAGVLLVTDTGKLICQQRDDNPNIDNPGKVATFGGAVEDGSEFGGLVAYRLINEAIPGIIQGDYKPCKDLIFDYRWDMGSINNCSFVCPEIVTIAEKLRPLKQDEDIIFLSLSSVGPGFFIITKKTDKVEAIFSSMGMSTFVTDIYNGKYKIMERN